jgi:F-type H+-transporting ATPase subunit epsilon
MSSTLKLEIITPVETAYSADVQMVTLPAVEGQVGIYPSHVALVTRMLPGEMIIRRDGRDEHLVVGEGLVEITGDHVAIVTDMAIAVEKMDTARIEELRRQAEMRLHDKMADKEVPTASAALAGYRVR